MKKNDENKIITNKNPPPPNKNRKKKFKFIEILK